MTRAIGRSRTRVGPALAMAFGSLMLSGCGAAAGPASPLVVDPAAEGGAHDASEPSRRLVECLTDTWQLDTADYLSQSASFMRGVGIPLDSLDVLGGQQIVFRADGHFSQATDMTWNASILGHPLSVVAASFGTATWAVEDGTLAITDWDWLVAPASTAAEAAPGVPAPEFPSISVEGLTSDAVECGDTLVLQGAGAPLRAMFVRFPG